ncbi:MAG: hypothetical protein QOF78_2238, partial [Phycisphaerales bacterium]|nr:hypothetical protein [Phycisphaerales bacterium]
MEALERRILYAAGDLDSSWGDGGIVGIGAGAGTNAFAENLLLDAHGRMLVAGYATDANGVFGLWLARYNADGTPDTTFGGGDGQVVWHDMKSGAVDLDIDANGNILVTGSIWTTAYYPDDWGVWRFHNDGSLDASFGDNGFVHGGNSSNIEGVCSVLALPDGKIMTVE